MKISYRCLSRTCSDPSLILSSYSGYLSSTGSVFNRPGGVTGDYYYQAVRLVAWGSGNYILSSKSSIDTYGYLYRNLFDPSSPSQNLITSDDDSAGDGQFQISVYLSYGLAYILIVTTHSTNEVGSFSVRASGRSVIDLTAFTPTTSIPPVRTTSKYIRQHQFPSDHSSADASCFHSDSTLHRFPLDYHHHPHIFVFFCSSVWSRLEPAHK